MRLLMTLALLAASSPASALVVASGSGAIDGTEATQSARINRDGVASSWSTPKSFPGSFSGTWLYDNVAIAFAPNATQDVYYDISYAITDAVTPHLVAYGNGFDPLDISIGYLGDPGTTSAGELQSFQVIVGAGNALLLNFSGVNGQLGGYTYSVSAFSDAVGGESFGMVPEPQSWAMLIAGFGLVGAMARRRRTFVQA